MLGFIKDDSMLFTMLKIDKKKIEQDALRISEDVKHVLNSYHEKLDKIISLLEDQNDGRKN